MQRALAALVVVVLGAGCAAPSPDSSGGSLPGLPVFPAVAPAAQPDGPGETGLPAGSAQAGAPDVIVEAAAGSAILRVDPPLALRSLVVEGNGQRRLVDGLDHSWVEVGFLQPRTDYLVHATLTDGRGQAVVEVPVRTADGPNAARDPSIHPGVQVRAGAGPCTLNFLLRDATNTTAYGLTAGHCALAPGTNVTLVDPLPGRFLERRIGTVVAWGDPLDPARDWALIQFDAAVRGELSGAVGHWTGPTGVFDGRAAGDGTACHVGWGAGLGWMDQTRTRCAVFRGYDATYPGRAIEAFGGDATHGDSGSPVVELATGRAMGMIVRAAHGYAFSAIDTCTLIQELHEAGYDLALMLAAYTPRDPVETPKTPGLEPTRDPPTCPANVLEGWWPA